MLGRVRDLDKAEHERIAREALKALRAPDERLPDAIVVVTIGTTVFQERCLHPRAEAVRRTHELTGDLDTLERLAGRLLMDARTLAAAADGSVDDPEARRAGELLCLMRRGTGRGPAFGLATELVNARRIMLAYRMQIENELRLGGLDVLGGPSRHQSGALHGLVFQLIGAAAFAKGVAVADLRLSEEPTGNTPLIDFLMAVIEPLFEEGEAPSPRNIARTYARPAIESASDPNSPYSLLET